MRWRVRMPQSALRPSTNGPAAFTTVRAVADELLAGLQVTQPDLPAAVDPFRAGQLDVVGHRGAGLDGGPDEGEHEPGVVVLQVAVPVLDPAPDRPRVDHRLLGADPGRAQQARVPGAEAADGPVGGGTERREPRRVGRRVVQRGQEGELGDVVRIGLHQPVAGPAELVDEHELVVLQVLEAAPHQVGRLLAGERREVAAFHQRHGGATAGQRRCHHGTVDATTDDEHVERPAPQPVNACVTKGHARTVPTGPAARRRSPAAEM